MLLRRFYSGASLASFLFPTVIGPIVKDSVSFPRLFLRQGKILDSVKLFSTTREAVLPRFDFA